MSSVLRNYRKIYTTPGADPSMPGRVYNLETNEYKVTYYQVVTGTSGTLTVPSGGTINSNEFGLSGNAILSKVDVNGKPTFESPVTSGGSQVTASLNVLTGAWVASGVYTSSSVALIYSVKIKGIDYHNLVYNNIIETVKVTADVSTINLQSVTDGGSFTTHVIETDGFVKTGATATDVLLGDGSTIPLGSIVGTTPNLQEVTNVASTTTNSITANSFIKTGGTSSQFLKADGSVDSTTYLSTQVVPAGGTTGQILAKVDDTSYNLEWIENYANYTSVLKHTVKAGEAISKGQAVYVSSADGTNMIVSKASNTSEATSSKTMGLLAQTLATNGKGFVITEGLLDNVNTLGATVGDPVWLGTSGNLIFGLIGKPYAPAHLVFIGIVTRVSGTVGEIFVKVQNGFELNEIHDVDLKTTTPINGHILGFNGSLWVNKTIAGWLGYTPYDASNPSGFITSSALTPYLTSATAASTYYPLTNPTGFITSSALTPYLTINDAALTYFPIPTGTTSQYLRGDGTLATFPTIPTVTPSALTKTDDTNVTLTLGGSPSTALLAATSITVGWTGTLADSRIASAATWNAKQDALSGTGFVKSTAGVISYDTNTYLTTTSALSTYVPYTGATANLNLGTRTLTTPTINGVSGLLSFGSTDRVSVGNYATPLSQRAFTVGQDTGWMTIGSCTDSTSNMGIFFNATAFGVGNATLRGTNAFAVLNTLSANGNIFIKVGGTDRFVINGINAGNSSFELTGASHTNRTASLSIAGFQYNSFNRQWATGAITTQSENVWGATTYSFVGASTITNAYGNVFNAPVAGTNATITNNYSAQFNGKVQINGNLTNNGAIDAQYFLTVTNPNLVATAAARIQVTNGAGNASVFSIGSNGDAVDPSMLYLGGSNKGILFTSNSVGVLKVFDATRNVTIQNGGTFTDNGYRLEVVGTSYFTDRVAINYPSLSSIYKLGVGGSMVVNGQIIVQDDSGVFAAYSSDGLTQSGGFNFNRYVGVNIYSSNTNPIKFAVNSAEALRIFNGGNISIGSTTDAGYKLNVTGTGNFTDRVNIGNYASPSAQRIFTVGQDTAFVSIGSLVGSTGFSAMYMNTTTPNVNNFTIRGGTSDTSINCPSAMYLARAGNIFMSYEFGMRTTWNMLSNPFGYVPFNITKNAVTGATASTPLLGWNYTGGSTQWPTGNIATQSEIVWGATTYSFVGASTITNAYGNVFNAPIAGTNATITNNWAAQFNGNVVIGSTGQLIEIKQTATAPTYTQTGSVNSVFTLKGGTRTLEFASYGADNNYITAVGAKLGLYTVGAQAIGFFTNAVERMTIAAAGQIVLAEGVNYQLGTTTGTKFGILQTQKLSFWNATPIVQPANTTSLNGVLENTGLMASGSTISTINKPLVVGANTTPRTGVATDGVTSVLGNLQNFTTNYHSGEVLYSEVSGEALNFGQLCYRDRFGKWSKALGDVADVTSYNMLGICLHTVGAADTAISILTRGYVESTYLSAGTTGDPLFMSSATAGSITNTAPSTAGNVVRVIGNLFWENSMQTNNKWIVYFNPDNTWIEL